MSPALEERLERVLAEDKGEHRACDMHVHSSSSYDVPTLARYHPMQKMVQAFEHGMYYFTLTDHNTIDGIRLLRDSLAAKGELGEKALSRVFPGVEIDCYVESLGRSIHTNVWGLTERNWKELSLLYDRSGEKPEMRDFPGLMSYLREEKLLYSFNHPFWSEVDDQPLQGILKRALPLPRFQNSFSLDIMSTAALFPEFPLVEKNGSRIEPLNDLAEYFAKLNGIPLVAGSDDHVGVELCRSYTLAPGETPREFLGNIPSHGRVVHRSLDADEAEAKAREVVRIYFGDATADKEFFSALTNVQLGRIMKRLTALWKPKYLTPAVETAFAKIGARIYLETQRTCLPPELLADGKTPMRVALERLTLDHKEEEE
ncbi:PHP domain-containing protein [Candidatus Woesearchaeota archaeon]|nr:PHP domain-containing protein [Candidatus Woesearchaeota archaeon]